MWKIISDAYKKQNYDLVKRHTIKKLCQAEIKNDNHSIAICHYWLGNVAEVENKIGDALRNWSKALFIFQKEGMGTFSGSERIIDLIRRWHDLQSVFVSYAHKDKNIIGPILQKLREENVKLFIDVDFLAGRSLETQIKKAVQSCPKFLVFYSKNYLKRSWTKLELLLLKEKYLKDVEYHAIDNCVIFVCLDNSKLPDEFRTSVTIKYTSLVVGKVCKKITEAIKKSAVELLIETNNFGKDSTTRHKKIII